MNEAFETYVFHCVQCGAHWTEEYEVRFPSEPGSRWLRVFYRDGFPVSPPRFGVACRACGGYRVQGIAQKKVA